MAANETRRNVMQMAWSFFREARANGESRSFADCLRGAWAFSKRLAQTAGQFMARARRAGGRVRLSPSLIRSPLGRSLGHGTQRDFQAAYLTARIGY